MIRRSITVAEQFMMRRDGKRGLRWEFAVVVLVGILGAVGHAYVSWRVISATETETLRFVLAGFVLEPLFGIFLVWFGYAIVLHYLANSVYNSRRPLSQLLKLVAWSIVPIGLGNLLRSGVLFLTFRDVEYETVLENQDARGLTEGLGPVLEAGMSDSLYLLAPVLIASTVIASGYLLVSATATAKDISRDDALRVVAVVVGAHVLYILYSTSQLLL